MPSPTEVASLLYAAAAEPLGIYLLTPNPLGLKRILYSARYRLKDPRLAHLQIRTDPTNPGGCLWVVNPGVRDEDAPEEPSDD